MRCVQRECVCVFHSVDVRAAIRGCCALAKRVLPTTHLVVCAPFRRRGWANDWYGIANECVCSSRTYETRNKGGKDYAIELLHVTGQIGRKAPFEDTSAEDETSARFEVQNVIRGKESGFPTSNARSEATFRSRNKGNCRERERERKKEEGEEVEKPQHNVAVRADVASACGAARLPYRVVLLLFPGNDRCKPCNVPRVPTSCG